MILEIIKMLFDFAFVCVNDRFELFQIKKCFLIDQNLVQNFKVTKTIRYQPTVPNLFNNFANISYP